MPASCTRRSGATCPTSTRGWRRGIPARWWPGSARAIHRRGRMLAPRALIAEAVGREPDERALLSYLEAKYRALHDL